ncbi:MAG: hypothetical protein C0394_10245, partial [Syntrophus sp. (in: bacteria)]|nr:hypothetical protein [Syntrophus sp. (in: bacteria)]
MEDVIINFIAALRNAGVRISVSESLDAVRAALLVGFSERQAIKDSLAATLAKSVGEKEKFDACFDRYFSCDFFNSSKNAPRRIDPEIGSMIDSDIASMAIYGDAAGIAALIRDAAQASDISSIRYSTQRNIYSARMLEIMGMPQLDSTLGRLKSMQDSGAAQAAAVHLADGKKRIIEAVRNYVEREYQLYAKSSDDLMESYLKTTRLTNIEQYYFGKMHEIIQKLVKQLEDRYSRRVKAAKRGKLDYKKTMRKGVCYGGFMFEPFWKKKKMDRPDVIAICDISRSVSRVVRFFLMFLYSMQKRIGRIRILAFCSNLADVTDIFEKYPIEEALSRMQDDPSIPIIRGRTDYDRTLTEFKEHYLSLVTKNTTVLILGDARNNYYNSRADILKM